MRNTLTIIVLYAIFGISNAFGQKPTHATSVPGGPTEITIKLAYPMMKTAKLIGFFADQNYIVDTIVADRPTLKYSNPKGLNQGLYYLAFSDKDIIQLIMDEDQKFEVSVDFRDFLGTIKFTGHEDNQRMYEMARWEAKINPMLTASFDVLRTAKPNTPEYEIAKKEKLKLEDAKQAYIDSLMKSNPNSLFTKYKLGGQNPKLRDDLPETTQVSQYRRDFWNNVDFSDLRLLYTPMINNKVKRYFGKDLTPQNPDSIIVAAHNVIDKTLEHKEYYKFIVNWLLFAYEPGKSSVMDSEAIFVDITQNYVTQERAFWAEKEVIKAILQRSSEMSASRLGQPAPNVISTGPDGKQHELLASKADYIVVYMFNPDCEHCQEQSPKLVEFFHANRGKVDVFAIALDTDHKEWTDYIAKVGMDWTNVYDPTNRSIYGKYWVDITPELYVINKDRILIGKNLKVNQIQSVIDRDQKLKK